MEVPPSFISDVETLLQMTQHTIALQEENEELKVRLETFCLRAASIWDDVNQIRDEIEVRVARLELQVRGVQSPSSAVILATRTAECAPYADNWEDIHSKVKAMEATNISVKFRAMEYSIPDEMELEWLRSALAKNIAALKLSDAAATARIVSEKVQAGAVFTQTEEEEEEDEEPPPVPSRSVPWNDVPEVERKPQKALTFDDATRVLHLTVASWKLPHNDEEIVCVVSVDGCRRQQVLSFGAKRRSSVAPPQSMAFPRWSQNSSTMIKIFRGGEVLCESEYLPIRNLVTQKDTKVISVCVVVVEGFH
jgi:hypothetical protein